MRGMSRLDQAFLFPIAYLSMIAIDNLRARYSWGTKATLILILPLLIGEASMTSMPTSPKDTWNQRFTSLNAIVPENLPDNSILFFAQRSGPPYASELDSMWVSLHHKKKTINGYSGALPPGFDYEFGVDCSQIPKRIFSYLKFTQQSENIIAYRELMSRIVPVGFSNCDTKWLQNPPIITTSEKIYTPDEFRGLSWGLAEIKNINNQKFINFTIQNSSDINFSANSAIGKPIRISWRFVDEKGQALSGWNSRKDLSFDIPENGELAMIMDMDSFKNQLNAKAIELTLVQELVFWAHEIGLKPLTVPLR
jgi:hypothetical protein